MASAISPNCSSCKNASPRSGGRFDVDRKRKRVELIESESVQPGFWDDQKKAQALSKEKSGLEAQLLKFEKERAKVDDAVAMYELAEEANDEGTRAEAAQAALDARAGVERLEMARMLSGPQDHLNAIVEINAGAGGTESQDWAAMLYRMYTRYAENKGWQVEPGDFQPGEEAGIKSGSIIFRGENAYGWLKPEVGVHRLVRISPFDSNARRHTSFASVFVYPEVDDDIEVVINPADVRIDTFRSSGAGGQKVNKTDSAVRMTHLPSGIVVSMQNERSQHKNRDMAWKVLRSRIYEMELRKQQAVRNQVEAGKSEISFGSQIRNYVLAPYRLVKDVRTGVESGSPDKVLDGDLDAFTSAFLMGVKRSDRGGPADDDL